MNRLKRLAARWRANDGPAALGGLGGFLAVMLPVAAGFAWGLPLGFGAWLEIPIYLGIMFVVSFLAAHMLAGLLSLIPLAVPRLTISMAALGTAAAIVGFHEAEMSWRLAIGLGALLCFMGVGTGVVGYLYVRKRNRVVSWVAMGLVIPAWLGGLGWLLEAWPGHNPVYQQYAALYENGPMPQAIQAEHPGTRGSYPVSFFTYGSGQDRFRSEYGTDADLRTEPADASSITDSWSGFRHWFWQTDISALPLNGRVWMPEGEGPFPLVLMVHGNHLMEEFSEAGYAYLGEHFASRGFIAVSVDENFANFSVWSQGQQQNMFLREWGLIEHLRAIDRFHRTAGNAFSGKVDFDRIALIGHSRGGQAVVMAADEGYSIRSIAALAPTDWRINKKYLRLQDVNYLVMQGSQDGDISTFDGDRQYRRVTFTKGQREHADYRFKAAVYIIGANHGQFNTGWDDRDVTRPTHFLLNHKDLLPGTAQRHAALVYLTAFLEATLHEQLAYVPMFQDWRTAAEWLPATGYLTQYADSHGVVLEDYELASRGLTGISSRAEALTASENVQVRDRQGNSKQNRGAELAWEEAEGKYTLQLPEDEAQLVTSEDVLAFSLAVLPSSDTALQAAIPEIMLEVSSADGKVGRIELDQYMDIPPPVFTRFTQHPLLEHEIKQGRYRHPFEPVFQSVRIPFQAFQGWTQDGDHEQLKSITWVIRADEPGRLLLDDISIYPPAF